MKLYPASHDPQQLARIRNEEQVVLKFQREISFKGLWDDGLLGHQWTGDIVLTRKAIYVNCWRNKPQTFEKELLDIFKGMAQGGVSVPREVIPSQCIRIDIQEVLSICVPRREKYIADVSIKINSESWILLPGKSGPHSFASVIWLTLLDQLLDLAINASSQNRVNDAKLIKDRIKGFGAVFNAQELTSIKHSQKVSSIVCIKGGRYVINPSALDIILKVEPDLVDESIDSGQLFVGSPDNHFSKSSLSMPFTDPKNKMLGNNLVGLFLPKISQFGREYVIVRWLIDNDTFVKEDEPVVQILVRDVGCCSHLKAVASGRLRQIRFAGKMLEVGEMLGIIDIDYSLAKVESPSSFPVKIASSDNIPATTSDAIRKGLVATSAGSIPKFIPSLACEPIGFSPHETPEDDLKFAFSNVDISFQSFYNDLKVISASGVNDDVVSCACFDESLYCALVREMHRYSLAEISDNQTDLAKKNAGLGAMVGSLLGLMSGNIFAPFLGHSYGKNLSDRSRRVEEFLPDPNLLFYQDENSYLSWSKGQVTSPRLRRLIIDRRLKPDGNVFFRLVPAIVTADSVFPVQLFKVDSSTYFYRPFSAGIQRNQPHYDSIKIQRRYFHLRGEGSQSGTEVQVLLSGKDVEDEKCPVFRFKGSSLDYFYLDFKIHPGSVF